MAYVPNPPELNEVLWDEQWRMVRVLSDALEEGVRYWKQQGLDGFAVSPYKGYKLDNLAFVDGLKPRALDVYGPIRDISAIESCKGLARVGISNNTAAVDLTHLIDLEKVALNWHPKIRLPSEKAKKLHTLVLTNWPGKQGGSFSDLPAYPGLRNVAMTQASLSSVDGIEVYNQLQRLSFTLCRNLKDLSALSKLRPSLLYLDTCRKICVDSLSDINSLRSLDLISCGEIKTLGFIASLPNLEELNFYETNVLDGDMTPLLRLKKVRFLKKRHFSHSLEEITALIARQQGTPPKV